MAFENGNDELTEKMHSEFNITPEAERNIKVRLALKDMKKLGYTIEQVMELYGLTEGDFDIVEEM